MHVLSLDVSATIAGEFGYIHLVVISQAEMEEYYHIRYGQLPDD